MDSGMISPKGPARASLVLAIRTHERAKSRGEEEGGGKRALGSRGLSVSSSPAVGNRRVQSSSMSRLKPVSFFANLGKDPGPRIH